MLVEQLDQNHLHASAGFAEHFTVGRTNRLWIFQPLAIHLGLLALHLFDQHTLPQSVIEVLQLVELLCLEIQCRGDLLRGLLRRFAGREINALHIITSQLVDRLSNFGIALVVERHVERALDAALLIVIRRSRAD